MDWRAKVFGALFVAILVIIGFIIIKYGWETMADVTPVIATITAVIAAGITLYFYLRNVNWNFYRYLADIYYDILKKGLENPEYCHPEKTRKYESEWPDNPEKYEYDSFARMCWAYAEDIYDAASRSFSKKDLIKIYAPTFERIKATHGVWLQNNRSTFPMTGFFEFFEFNKWRDYLDPSAAELLGWDYAAYDYDDKILNPIYVDKNPMLEYVRKISASDLIVADFGCGNGYFVKILAESGKFKKIYGLDYSDNMVKNARKKCEPLGEKVEILKEDMKDLARFREELKQKHGYKLDRVFSINSILPRNPHDTEKMLCQIAMTLEQDGEFVAILPSFDTVEYLKNLEINKFKEKRKEYLQQCYENLSFWERIRSCRKVWKWEIWQLFYYYLKFWWMMEWGAWKHLKFWDRVESGAMLDTLKLFYKDRKMNVNKRLYADDGINVQRFIHEKEIEPMLKKAGLKLKEKSERLYYPWDMAKRFNYGYFPGNEEIWDWFVVAEKVS